MEFVCLDSALKLTTTFMASGLHIISVAEHTSSGENWHHGYRQGKIYPGIRVRLLR